MVPTTPSKQAIINQIAIHETDVFGSKAYHCKCLTCGWQSKRKNTEKQAIKDAGKHAECQKVRQS